MDLDGGFTESHPPSIKHPLLGGELPTFIVFVGEPGPLVISMGFLWGQLASTQKTGVNSPTNTIRGMNHQVTCPNYVEVPY